MTLAPYIKMDNEDKVKYQWYNWSSGNSISGANDKTFEIKNITGPQQYSVHILDGYGSEETIYYYIYVKSNFEVSDKESGLTDAEYEIESGRVKLLLRLRLMHLKELSSHIPGMIWNWRQSFKQRDFSCIYNSRIDIWKTIQMYCKGRVW